jgi:hypothetical protein
MNLSSSKPTADRLRWLDTRTRRHRTLAAGRRRALSVASACVTCQLPGDTCAHILHLVFIYQRCNITNVWGYLSLGSPTNISKLHIQNTLWTMMNVTIDTVSNFNIFIDLKTIDCVLCLRQESFQVDYNAMTQHDHMYGVHTPYSLLSTFHVCWVFGVRLCLPTLRDQYM